MRSDVVKPWQRASTVAMLVLSLAGCGAQHHRNQVQNDGARALTLGGVQKEIRVGMSSADVVAVLGSPNVVTTDDQRREVWVYDKISTETAYSRSEGGAFLLILGGSSESGARTTTQKTLTVIVKFDEHAKVRDFAYHSSKF
jgi:outer membrane protein assembly factor BamE (lipoprotein component of BamABCDE complex)